jgi:hypothetical protein
MPEADGTYYVYAVPAGETLDPANPGDPFPLLAEEDL